MADNNVIDNFKSVLRRAGYKVTPQRVAVLKEMMRTNGHRESEEIHLAIKNCKIHVSRATVYRTLDLLVENQFVRKLNLGDGKARYESKIDRQHHDHLICDACGTIFEFVDYEIEKLQEKIAREFQFILKRHTHQLFGICNKCQ